MLYFPLLWLSSVLFYILFFIKLGKNEKRYNLSIERYPGNKFPRISKIKVIIKNTNDRNTKKDFKTLLLLLYLSYTLFFMPIIIYFILGIWGTN
jgi:hypothetical protein